MPEILYNPEGFADCVLVNDEHADAIASLTDAFGAVSNAEDDTGTYTAFSYTPRVAAALRDFGIPATYPVKARRDFPLFIKGLPGKPFAHQIQTTKFLLDHGSAFVLNDAGTGKTLSVLWAWWYLRRIGRAGALLVVCPKSIVFSAWAADIMAALPQANVSYVVGVAAKRVKLCAPGYDIYVMNHDGIKHNPILFKNSTITHVAIDEASAFNDRKTERFKMLKKFCEKRTAWAMTATPVAHSPDRAWALAQLVGKTTQNISYSRFRSTVCYEVKVGAFSKWEPRRGAEKIVFDTLQPAIRFRKDDCLDLPPLMYEDRHVAPSVEQKKFVDSIIKNWQWEEMNGHKAVATISGDNAAIRLNKLLQAYQGAVIRDDKSILYVDCKARIDEVCAVIDESVGKVIIATPFRAVNSMLVGRLGKIYGHDAVAAITGSVGLSERTQIVANMQNEDHPLRILCAHPETASHGLTLTQASTTIWYGPYFKSEFYAQLNERMNRPGQVRSMRIVHIISDKLEQSVFELVRQRLATQDNILGLYKATIEG